MTSLRSALFLSASTAAALAGDAKSTLPPASGGDWQFSLSAGAAWRQSGTLDFRGGSYSGGIGIPSFVGGESWVVPFIGPPDATGNRTYDDGFVRRDRSTGFDSYTTNWGYQNAGQVAGNDISFHATGTHSIRTDTGSVSAGPRSSQEERAIAPVLDFAGVYQHEIKGFRFGFSASLIWSPVKFDSQWNDFTLQQERDDYRDEWTDSYNLGGVGSQIPAAPYTGSFGGPGFVLENIPDSRDLHSVLIGGDQATVRNQVTTRFRADHTTFSFGPTAERQLTPEWTLQAAAGVSIHWLRWSAKQKESLSVDKNGKTREFQSWSDKGSGNEILGGVYLQVGVDWKPVEEAWSIRGFVRADFGDEFSEKIGPSKISYDTDGFTAAVMYSHGL